MQTIFDTRDLAPELRFRAWREMLCDVYINLDVATPDPSGFEGRVRLAQFGAVRLTEVTGSSHSIMRGKSHVAASDKDCFYMPFLRYGAVQSAQRNSTVVSHPGAARLISSSDPYDSIFRTKCQALYLEIPRQPFLARFSAGGQPASNTILRTGSGLGRIAAEFCDVLAKENDALPEASRARLGEQVMDVLALALEGCRTDGAESSIQRARLRSIKAFIDANLANPNLSLALIAKRNDVSLSYLHHLFKASGESVSEWIWLRRLQRCYEMITQPDHAQTPLTEIAFSMGFSSSSHFSNLFREKFGMRPSDLRRPKRDVGSIA